MNNTILLIGFMGAGKSTIGKELALRLSYSFLDTDEMIERKEGREISQIFLQEGEETFRNMETTLLKELNHVDKRVISLGGGMAIREENQKLMDALGSVIYLRARKDTIIKRLKGDRSRPLLKGERVEEKVENLMKEREPIYEKAAHILVDTDGKTIKEIVEEIVGIL